MGKEGKFLNLFPHSVGQMTAHWLLWGFCALLDDSDHSKRGGGAGACFATGSFKGEVGHAGLLKIFPLLSLKKLFCFFHFVF